MKPCIPLIALLRICFGGDGIDAQDLVRRAGSTMQSDWNEAPAFAFIPRDLTTSKGMTTRKPHQVLSISGSDYYMPIAINHEPLPAGPAGKGTAKAQTGGRPKKLRDYEGSTAPVGAVFQSSRAEWGSLDGVHEGIRLHAHWKR